MLYLLRSLYAEAAIFSRTSSLMISGRIRRDKSRLPFSWVYAVALRHAVLLFLINALAGAFMGGGLCAAIAMVMS